MFDNNIRPISMWSREVGGTVRGPSGGVGVAGVGVGRRDLEWCDF